MKRFIFLNIYVCLSIVAFAQANKHIEMTYKDGRAFTPNIPITATDTIVFRNDLCSLSWCFRLIQDYSSPIELEQASHEIRLCASEIQVHWARGKRYYDKSGNTIYRGYLVYKSSENNILDSVPLQFRLTPPKPKIKSIEFRYDQFFSDEFVFINPECTIQVESKGDVEDFFCSHSESFLTEKDNDWLLFYGSDGYNQLYLGNDVYSVDTDWGIGEYIAVYAENKYGYSQVSDTIYTTNYIKDKQVLDAWNLFVGISKNTVSSVDFYVNHKCLYVNKVVDAILIYDINGNLLLRKENTDTLQLPDIGDEICIVKVIDDKHVKTKKIRL